MSRATLIKVSVVLGVLLAAWGVAELLRRGSDPVERAQVVSPVAAAAVDTVVIVHEGDTLTLYEAAGRWVVNGFAAAPNSVDDMLEAMADGEEGTLIARSASSHSRMGVDSTGGRLRVFAGGQWVTDLIVGERGSGFRGRYVRRADGDRVYLLEGTLADMVGRSENDWRDKTIVAIEPATVGWITVETGRSGYTLLRRDTIWTFADGSPTDSAAVRRMLDEWRNVQAQGASPFATLAQVDSADFARPERRAVLVGVTGDTLARLLFDSTDAGFWVRHDSGGTVFNLFRWKVDDLMPRDSVLRANR